MGVYKIQLLFKMEQSINQPNLSVVPTKLSSSNLAKQIIERQKAKDIANGIVVDDIVNGAGHAFGYTRVSTKMQVEDGSSLDAQKRTIEDYCRHKKLILDKIYTDAGLSGGDQNRPALKQLMTDLIPGMGIVAVSSDRLGRDLTHIVNLKNEIHSRACHINIIDTALDTSTIMGDAVFNVLSSFAEMERRNNKVKISGVMQDMSREGTLRKKPRYGWKVVNKEVVPDPDEQMVIDLIRTYIQEDQKITLTAIVNRLKSLQIKIRKGANIYPTTIKNIIEGNNLRETLASTKQ